MEDMSPSTSPSKRKEVLKKRCLVCRKIKPFNILMKIGSSRYHICKECNR